MAEGVVERISISPAGMDARALKRGGFWHGALRRFLTNRIAVFGGVIVLLFVLVALFGPAITPKDPLKQDLLRIAQPPSTENWFGTDELGRDLFSRVLAGARTAFIVAVVVTAIAAGMGTFIGLVSAYAGGWIDSMFMRTADLLLAFPTFVLAAFLNATMRPPVARKMQHFSQLSGIRLIGNPVTIDFVVVFGALALVSWPGYARLIRSQVLSLRTQEYVEAARSIGATSRMIMTRHLLPNSIAPIIVAVSVNFCSAILAESALSYLGVGIQPPAPSWGQMINANLDQWRYYPHLVLVPGIVLATVILGFNFFGDGLADALDPRQGSR